jgi:multidrug transporter EmrE-like cation transporter
MVVLANMEFDWFDATALFVLWVVQFLAPGLREEVSVAYALWIAILVVGFAVRAKPLLAPKYFWETITKTRSAGTA